jgi:AraC-like DNA-binding protein
MRLAITNFRATADKSHIAVANIDKRTENRIFISTLLLFGCYFLINSLASTDTSYNTWQLTLASNLCVLLFMPLGYLYTRSVVLSMKPELNDIGHMLPALVYATNYLLVFLVPHDTYYELTGTQWTGILYANSYNGSFFNPGSAYISFYHYIIIIYLVLQVVIVCSGLKEFLPNAIKEKLPSFRWVALFGAMQLFFFYHWLSALYIRTMVEWYTLQVATIVSCIIVVGVFIKQYLGNYFKNSAEEIDIKSLSDEEVINRFELDGGYMNGHTEMAAEHALSHSIIFQEHQLAQIEETVGNVMLEKRPFLNHGYTIRMLSDDTGIKSHILSAYINRKYGMNFNDFINEYRIKFCIEKIKKDEWKYKTLEALSRESGFNNRNSFTLSFKKMIGLTPSSFLKQLRVED